MCTVCITKRTCQTTVCEQTHEWMFIVIYYMQTHPTLVHVLMFYLHLIEEASYASSCTLDHHAERSLNLRIHVGSNPFALVRQRVRSSPREPRRLPGLLREYGGRR